MNKIIIIGGNHHNTLGVIRSVGRCGIKPIVILTSKSEDSFVLRSKYIDQYWIVKHSEVVDFLLNNFVFEEKAVLIGCHDIISSLFDLNYKKLSEYFFVPGCKEDGKISRLAEKDSMSRLALSVGMNVPEYKVLNSSDCLDSTPNFVFPCITKPSVSRDGSKADICICNNENDLKNYFARRPKREFVVQTFVDKDFEYQLIGCSLNDGNLIIIPGISKIIRPSRSSNTGFLKYGPLDNSFDSIIQKSKNFIKSTGYNGLFSMEFLRDKNSVDYFIEINFRNDGNAICVTNAGVNLPMIWYNHSINHPLGNLQILHTEYVMPEFQELYLWYSGGISFRSMINDFRKATSYMDFDRNDPKPTFGWLVFYIHLICRLLMKPIKQC